jgi:hypothetical protein
MSDGGEYFETTENTYGFLKFVQNN